MADRDVRITVKTTAQTKALKETEKVLDAINQELKENNKLTADQSQKLKSTQASLEKYVTIQKRNLATQEQVKTSARTAGRETRNLGLAALEASRAIEDLQYGLAGVLNNLPNLVQRLGGPAGLAAVISLAAVGAFQLSKAFGASADSAQTLAEKEEEAAKALERLADIQKDLSKRASADAQARADAIITESKRVVSQLDSELHLHRELSRIDLERADADLSVRLADIDASDATPQQKARQRAEVEVEALNRRDSAATAQREKALEVQQLKIRRATEDLQKLEEEVRLAEEEERIRKEIEQIEATMNRHVARIQEETQKRVDEAVSSVVSDSPLEAERAQAEAEKSARRKAEKEIAATRDLNYREIAALRGQIPGSRLRTERDLEKDIETGEGRVSEARDTLADLERQFQVEFEISRRQGLADASIRAAQRRKIEDAAAKSIAAQNAKDEADRLKREQAVPGAAGGVAGAFSGLVSSVTGSARGTGIQLPRGFDDKAKALVRELQEPGNEADELNRLNYLVDLLIGTIRETAAAGKTEPNSALQVLKGRITTLENALRSLRGNGGL